MLFVPTNKELQKLGRNLNIHIKMCLKGCDRCKLVATEIHKKMRFRQFESASQKIYENFIL